MRDSHAASARRPRRAALRTFLGLVLPAVLAAVGGVSCHAPTKEFPVSRVVEADNERVLWNALRIAIHQEEYRVGGVGADDAGRAITSAWKLDLSPFRRSGPRSRKGNRSRVIVAYEPFDGDRESLPDDVKIPDKLDPNLEPYKVRVRVEVENNESLRPLDLRFAKWVPADDDPAVAQRVFLKLSGLLGTTEFRLSEKEDAPFSLD